MSTERNEAIEAEALTKIANDTWVLVTLLVITSVVLTVAGWFIARSIGKVLTQMVASMQAAAKRDYNLRVKSSASRDLAVKTDTFDSLLDSMVNFEEQAVCDAARLPRSASRRR